MYFLCLLVAVVVYLAMDRLVNSRFGRALKAISQDEDAARACGISINLYKSKCFLVAAFTAGIAGSLYAHQARYLNPNDFTFNKSIEILIMVVVGGLGSLPGAVIGALDRRRDAGIFAVVRRTAAHSVRGAGCGVDGFQPRRHRRAGARPRTAACALAGLVGRKSPHAGEPAMTALLRTEQLTCRFGGLVAVGGVEFVGASAAMCMA